MNMTLSTATKLKEICARTIDKKIPAALGYKTMKLIKAVEVEEDFYNLRLRQIIEEFGKKDAEGKYIFLDNGNIKVIEGKESECEAKIKELEGVMVDFPDTFTFTLEELDALECTPREIYYFDELIK